jgi:hypothetical protein
LSFDKDRCRKKRKTTKGAQVFTSQEEIDAYVEEQIRLAPTRYALSQAFPKQGKAGSAWWLVGRYLVKRTKQIVIGGKKESSETQKPCD